MPEGANLTLRCPRPRAAGGTAPQASEVRRLTLDGSDRLEDRLRQMCAEVVRAVQAVVAPRHLHAIVLGGGYGRGEGGVLRGEVEDQPYNDLDFYVFLREPLLLRQLRYGPSLEHARQTLCSESKLEVEFKLEAVEKLRRSPVSMFSYDLVAAQRVLFGKEPVFEGCAHHLDAQRIPWSEATRLLFNRCSGLLLARELIAHQTLSAEEADFAVRNMAKANLALGDALLTALGLYHWSSLRRARMLASLVSDTLPWLEEVQRRHAAGVEFKLHPHRTWEPGLAEEHLRLSQLALQVWLWLESLRLGLPFPSARSYAFNRRSKFPETATWRNYLLTMRTFGVKALSDPWARRHPRERLLNVLALMLWQRSTLAEPDVLGFVQQQLRTAECEQTGLVTAYKRLWKAFG
jgi:hypothetical protein